MMKALPLVFILLSVFTTGKAASIDSLWQKGNDYYVKKDFTSAALCYETVLKAGKESPELYFNLGNAYFKLSEYSRAIINFERTLKLSPDHQDAIFNLSVANTHTTDKIELMPDIFFLAWFKTVRNWMSPDTWAILAIAMFISLLTIILLILLVPSLLVRRLSFATSFFVLFFFVIALILAISSYRASVSKNSAIVIAPSVVVKSSPDETATDLFMIHEGTKVSISEQFDNWIEVQIADGNRGWIEVGSVEVI